MPVATGKHARLRISRAINACRRLKPGKNPLLPAGKKRQQLTWISSEKMQLQTSTHLKSMRFPKAFIERLGPKTAQLKTRTGTSALANSYYSLASHQAHVYMHCETRAGRSALGAASAEPRSRVPETISGETRGNCTGYLLAQRPMAMLGMEIPQEPKPGLTNELAAKKKARHVRVFLCKKCSRCSWLCFGLCCANRDPPQHGEYMERQNARESSSLWFAQAPAPVSEQGKQQIWRVCQRCPEKFSAWLEAVKISSKTVRRWGGSNGLCSKKHP